MGQEAKTPFIPIKNGRIYKRVIRIKIYETFIIRACLGFPIAWKNDLTIIKNPLNKS